MERLRALRLNPYVNIVIVGSGTVYEKIRSCYADHHKGNVCFPSNICVTTTIKIDEQTIYCNLWSANKSTSNNGRNFLSNHVDYCIIVCTPHNETLNDFKEYISVMETTCGTPAFSLFLVESTSTKHTIIPILEHAQTIGLRDCVEVPLDQDNGARVIKKSLLQIVHTIIAKRTATLNEKAKKIIRSMK